MRPARQQPRRQGHRRCRCAIHALPPPRVPPRIMSALRIREIYWCDLPLDAQLPEFWKRRPVLVLSKNSRLHGSATVLPFTTSLQRDNPMAYQMISPIDGQTTWVICDCTMYRYRQWNNGIRKGSSLDAVSTQFCLQGRRNGKHSALEDVTITAKIAALYVLQDRGKFDPGDPPGFPKREQTHKPTQTSKNSFLLKLVFMAIFLLIAWVLFDF